VVGTDLAETWPWPDVVKEGPAFRSVHFTCSSHAALRVGGLLLVLHPPSDSAKLVNISWPSVMCLLRIPYCRPLALGNMATTTWLCLNHIAQSLAHAFIP
jgi:hypothetical protein